MIIIIFLHSYSNQSQFYTIDVVVVAVVAISVCTNTPLNNILCQCESSFECNANLARNSHLSMN